METKTKFERLGLFDARVPRYTSYPTAPHFSDDVDASDAGQWLKTIDSGTDVSLYVHIPFCRRLCWFCACRTQGTSTNAPVESYVNTLCDEVDLLAATLPDGIRLSRLHWGGGTPTLLTPDLIEKLATHISSVLPFADNAEFSVEIDPNELDLPRLQALVAAGLTRASIGIQDFDPDIQAIIGRDQSFEITAKAVQMLRDVGVQSLNADILFGLPHQSPQRIASSVTKLLSLSPDRVALYGYAHVPWMARRQTLIPTDTLPTPHERLDLFEVARKLFLWDGYQEIGIDHFAVPSDSLAVAQRNGDLRRNFQGYTDDQSETLIGLGASAISRFPQGYAQNNPVTSRYVGAIENGQFATSRGHRFDGQDRLRGKMIERIMCDFEVCASDFPDDKKLARKLIRKVHKAFDGTLILKDDRLLIPEASRALTRMVAQKFDAYFIEADRHASAI